MSNTDKWIKTAKSLAVKSPAYSRMVPLLKNPTIGREKVECDIQRLRPECECRECSNCHGTTLYLLQGYDGERPQFYSSHSMKQILKESEVKSILHANVLGFWDNVFQDLDHTSLYLGQNKGIHAMFHQKDTGADFELNHLHQYLEEHRTLSPRFYHIDQVDLNPRILFFGDRI